MEEKVIDVMRTAFLMIIKVSAPMLLVALVVGLIVSVFQTTTSIQEQTLSFAPKIVAIFLAMIVFGPWMMNTLMEFINELYHSFNLFLK
ncbi:MAG TPA: flagellar biosynthesis protein FliQ [Epulopiscium sp.]|nr:flagellar biosynthesis protein FliQ [Candidatus Epulonipiscium sp.]